MLSQLSYAPVFRVWCAHLSDVVYYTQVGAVCQALFSIFLFRIIWGINTAYSEKRWAKLKEFDANSGMMRRKDEKINFRGQKHLTGGHFPATIAT